jgi:hypothetical protein
LYYIFLWNSKDIRKTIQKKKEEAKEEKEEAKDVSGSQTPSGLPLVSPVDIELDDSLRIQRGKSLRNIPAFALVELNASPSTPVVVNDETTGLPDLVSEWTDLLRIRLAKFSNDTNKRRSEENNLLRFFFVLVLVAAFVIVPVGFSNPQLAPNSFLCSINQAKFVTLNTTVFNNETITTSANLITIDYPRLTVPINGLVVLVLLIEVIMLRGVVDSYYLNHELRIILAILIIHAIIYLIIPFTGVAVFFITLQSLFTFVIQAVIIYWPFVLCVLHVRGDSNDEGFVAIEDTIDFVLENSEARALFKSHLAKSLCSEGVLFYESYLDFIHAPADMKQDIAQEMIDNFVRNGATNEVNLNGTIKKEIVTRFEDSLWASCPEDLFNRAIANLKLNLSENGTFKAFKATNEYKQWKTQRNEKNVKRVIELAL